VSGVAADRAAPETACSSVGPCVMLLDVITIIVLKMELT
jgi:hypothetical protein